MAKESQKKNQITQQQSPPITPEQFQAILPKICDSQTSYDSKGWTPDNPLYSHCTVVSVVAQSLFGGQLLRSSLEKYPDFAHMRFHYLNELPNGSRIDFTKPQFGNKYPQGMEFSVRNRQKVLSYQKVFSRFKLLSLRLAQEVTGNPLFDDPFYRRCFDNALSSPCQKMRFGALMVRDGVVVAESPNDKIKGLESFCDPVCIRIGIQSRTKSMLGACGHAEEWVINKTQEAGIDTKHCDLYVAGIDMKGMPWIKQKPEHTCLRCAVQMNFAGLRSIHVPVIDHWQGLSTSQALNTAKEYATGNKKII